MHIHIHIHHHDKPADSKLDRILETVIDNNEKLKNVMASEQEIIALLEEANTATNEIAEDIQKLLNKPGVPEAVKTALQAHVDRLKGVAKLSNEETTPPTEPTA